LRRQPPPRPGKQRTRAHVLADLSVNHVERFALRCGFAVHRISPDYGLDLAVFTFDEQGFLESGQIWMQLKASDNLKRSRDGKTVSIRIDRRDILAWIGEAYPVILVLYDATRDVAYYLSVKDYVSGHDIFAKLSGATVTIQVPTENLMSEKAFREFARTKMAVLPT
jgi:Domain of unknown function (DUF4365)